MLISSSKYLALLAFIAFAAAAPASSGMSSVTESSATDTSLTTEAQSTVPTTTKPSVLDQVVTAVPVITLVTKSASGSDLIITETIRVKTTLSPQSATLNPVPSAGAVTYSFTPAVAFSESRPVTTATSSTAASSTVTKNGAQAQNSGGIGLAAIIGVAGIVAAAL
ncbi:hypothetical protein M407DRAFT_170390 [Tulasnella calospora MUT 4182]|uniref:Uncharacterized protein n=1 Tax=Tulasnella calospora MUT 4182 TaxID=1051891 RepID=A0A0C3K812_9AGAM|nr:hypothetical protein M407DRAFT_170390 [Tulasnella calospora MUT 4182]